MRDPRLAVADEEYLRKLVLTRLRRDHQVGTADEGRVRELVAAPAAYRLEYAAPTPTGWDPTRSSGSSLTSAPGAGNP